MDDANLSSLTVSQNGLSPSFSKDITNYSLTVPCNIDKLNVTVKTSDTGASYSIKFTGGYGEEVKLSEGENKITIEVTSEDGTIKKYYVDCKRLSASDAQLKNIFFDETNEKFALNQSFSPSTSDYTMQVSCKSKEARFKLELFDPGCTIDVTFNKVQKIQPDNNLFYNLILNYGYSEIEVMVTSPNKTTNQIYVFKIIRNFISRVSLFLSIKETTEFEDALSLAPIYCAIKFQQASFVYSSQFLDFFQKITNKDQLSPISLSVEKKYDKTQYLQLENKISDLIVKVPLINGGYSEETKLRLMSDLIDSINKNDEFKLNSTDEAEFNNVNISSFNKLPDSLPAYQLKPWEKHLQIIYDETDPVKLIKISESHTEKYIQLLNNTEASLTKTFSNTSNNDSPLYYLNMSLYNLASSLKYKNRDYEVHFKLAALLEEKNFFENLYGKEKSKEDNEPIVTLSSQNKQASDSSKEEEITAIAKAKNFGPNPTDAEKLKALDQEYHYLVETNQNVKAEYVQQLYQFKSKKINEASKSSTKLSQTSDYLFQSNAKYLDGLAILLDNKKTNFHAYFIVGRSLCRIGDYSQSLIYLKECVNWSDPQFQSLARFYFGYALSKNNETLKSHTKMIAYFLSQGLQSFLKNISQSSFKNRNILLANDFFTIYNIEILEGFVILGKIKSEFKDLKFDFISSEDSFKYCAWLCCIALSEINRRTIANIETAQASNLIKDLIHILIEAHSCLVNLNSGFPSINDQSLLNELRLLQSKRCLNLIGLIRAAGNKSESMHLLKLQENICQKLVFVDPLNSYHLLLLGSSKLELYDYLVDNEKNIEADYLSELINESKNSLAACIEFDENEKNKEEVSSLISDQKWWKIFEKAEEEQKERIKSATLKNEKQANQTKSSQVATAPTNAVSKTAAPSKGPIKKATQPAAAPPSKAKITPASKGAAPVAKTNTPAKPSSAEKKPVAEQAPKSEPHEENLKNISKYMRHKKPLIELDNKILAVQSYLFLGRVYSRLKEPDQSRKFYEKIIKIEPQNQDSYIELAQMLRLNGDISGAIDVYSSYPIVDDNKASEKNQVFDDAFIYGELVTLLINAKNYDDPRLAKYLILWAKVMGIGIIEKYINILDKANKTKICKEVYASVNKKSIDDPDLAGFFKFKGWV